MTNMERLDGASGANPERWRQIAEWVRTSYTNVAPKSLAKQVLAEDGLT